MPRSAIVFLFLLSACGGRGAIRTPDGSSDGADRDAEGGRNADAGADRNTDASANSDARSMDAPSERSDARGNEAGADGGEAGTDGGGDGPLDAAIDADTTRMVKNDTVILPVEANDLVYDHTRNRLYASVSGGAAGYTNRIVVIDPAHDAVVSTIPVGSDPGPLALSDDDSTLWVGLTGAKAIRKITLPTTTSSDPVVGPLIHLPLDKGGFYFYTPLSMVVLPGAPQSIVLSMSDGQPTVAVLDDGVARQTTIVGGPPDLVLGPPGIVFGSGAVVGGLSVCSVTAFGVSQKTYGSVNGGAGFYMNDRLFQTNGDVLDVTDPLTPTKVGQLPASGPIAERDTAHVMILASTSLADPSSPPQTSLRFFDPASFIQVAAVPLSIPPVSSFGSSVQQLSSLVYAGDDAAAFIVTEISEPTRVAIAHSTVIRAPGLASPPTVDGGIPVEVSDGGARPGEPCAGCTFTAVAAFGQHITFDGTRNLIYLTADRAASVNPNTVVTVDPAQGTVVSALPVGTNPGPLALSDDGSTLWLGNTDDRTVQKITLGATQLAGPAYPLPAAMPYSTTPSTAQSIVVLPGAPASIAVGISGPEVVVLDDGVARATVDKDRFATASFLARGPGTTLFGYDTFDNFGVLDVSAAGIIQMVFGALVDTNNLREIVYLNGAVYGNDGTVIDVSNGSAPVPGGHFDYLGAAIAVRGPDRLLMLISDGSSNQTPVLRVLDTTTFTSVGAAFFPEPAIGRIPLIDDMVYLGGDAVAFLVYENNDRHLYIMHANVIGTPP